MASYVVAGDGNGIARLGTLGGEVVLHACTDALEVSMQPVIIEVVAGTFIRCGVGGVRCNVVRQFNLTRQGAELLTLHGAIGSHGRTQR